MNRADGNVRLPLVLLLIVCASALACLVGLIIAIPVACAALMYAYEDLFGTKAAAASDAMTPASAPAP
jgi:uncharacterized membrane protein